MTDPCCREGCPALSVAAIAIALFPPASVMRYYRSENPLTRLLLSMPLCEVHLQDAIDCGPWVLMPRETVKKFARIAESSSGTVVDLDGTRVVRVEFNDQEYIDLQTAGAQTPPLVRSDEGGC